MYDTSSNILINLEICPNQLRTKPRTKNRSRGSERLKRNQHLALKYRYSERRKGVHVAPAINSLEQVIEQDIFGRHFVCYFARARVKKPGYKQNNQPIRQKYPLLSVWGRSVKCLGLIVGVSFRRPTPSPYSLFSAISRSFRPLRERLEKERKRLLRRLHMLFIVQLVLSLI